MTSLAWAFGYNVLAIGLAMSGLLQPVIAAAMMAASSLIVVVNSLRMERDPETASMLGTAAPHEAGPPVPSMTSMAS